jgi:ParB family chromosome partitioning protein
MAATQPKKTAKSEERKVKSGTGSPVSPFTFPSSPELVEIRHTCDHTVTCPREFMPPSRAKKERARPCRWCRQRARLVAQVRNQERGLPALDETRGTPDQILLAEELRDRHGWDLEQEADLRRTDPVWWIARFAGAEDCLLGFSAQEEPVCGKAAAEVSPMKTTAEQDEEFERVFGEAPRPGDPESGEGPPQPCPPYEVDPEGPRACMSCGTLEDPGSHTLIEGSLLCDYCARQVRLYNEMEDARREHIRSIIDEDAPPMPGEPRSHPRPKVAMVGLARVHASPLNPRKTFDEAGLEELAGSIREHGLLEPLVARPRGSELELIAGERRLRAARLAGLLDVPVIVREADDREALALMLCENLQRENLNPIEEADAYAKLTELGMTQAEIARKVGKSRPVIANAVRLLGLPEAVRAQVADGSLSAAHGRALLAWADDPERCDQLADTARHGRVTSRDLEKLAAAEKQGEETHARIVAEAIEEEREKRKANRETPDPGFSPFAFRPSLPEDQEDREAHASELREAIVEARGRAPLITADPRAVALLAHRILRGTPLGTVCRVLADYRERGEFAAPIEEEDLPAEERWSLLAALPAERQLQLALSVLLQEELDAYEGTGLEPRQCRWFVADGCAAAEGEA